jgi:predicted nicotinamide N-methyase
MPARRHDVRAHGIRCLLSSHPAIRKLKRASPPEIHGTRQWPSSWLLIDYLSRHPLSRGSRVIEVGAGWGLAGIYCARRFSADVLAVDKDPAVFPYLELHAAINGVQIRTLRADFRRITPALLAEADVLIGSDICFWKTLVPEVRLLVRRAIGSGVGLVLIADPSRSTFEDMASDLVTRGSGRIVDWRISRPRAQSGRILRAPALAEAAAAPYTEP